MSKKIEIVYELTRDEALALVALIGSTSGMLGYEMYQPLWQSLGGYHSAVSDEAEARFPGLRGEGRIE